MKKISGVSSLSSIYWVTASYVLLVGATVPYKVLAACTSSSSSGATGSNGSVTFQNPLCYNSIQDLVNAAMGVVATLGAIIAVLVFIYAGFLYISAQGDESKVKKAHEVFRNAIIGTAILLSATLIVTIIETTITSVQSQSGLSTSSTQTTNTGTTNSTVTNPSNSSNTFPTSPDNSGSEDGD